MLASSMPGDLHHKVQYSIYPAFYLGATTQCTGVRFPLEFRNQSHRNPLERLGTRGHGSHTYLPFQRGVELLDE